MTGDQKTRSGYIAYAKAHPIRGMVVLPSIALAVIAGWFFAVSYTVSTGKWLPFLMTAFIAIRGGVKAYRQQKAARSTGALFE